MAGSIKNMAAVYPKIFKYVPPTPPTELLESTSYTIDFTNRKFVNIGIEPSEKFQVVDPTEKYQVVIHLITSSRYVKILPDFLRRIISMMGHILSYILDVPQKYKRTIFLETEFYKISSMMYSGENVLVIESKTEDGCRVLLNRADLIRLQYLECCIYESIVRKTVYTAQLMIDQTDEFAAYLREKFDLLNPPPKNLEEMIIFVKNARDERTDKSFPHLASQIQMFAAKQLAESLLNPVTHEPHSGANDLPVPPSYSLISSMDSSEDPESQLLTESEMRLISPLSPPQYSSMSPMYDDNDFDPSQVQADNENRCMDEFLRQINPTQATWAPTKPKPSSLPLTSFTSPAFDENDGPTSFNKSPSILGFTGGKPTKKRNAKRKLFLNDIV